MHARYSLLSLCAMLLAFVATQQGKAQPVNDVCATATPLTILGTNPASPTLQPLNWGFGATASLSGTTNTGANCQPSFAQDVWYEVTATNNILYLQPGLAFEVYESCAQATAGMAYACPSFSNAHISVTPGNTYYLRFTWLPSSPRNSASFRGADYGLQNDLCSSALGVTTQLVYDRTRGTASGVQPSCRSTPPRDSWYSLVAPSTGAVNFLRSNSGGQVEFTIYEGSCGNLTELGCLIPTVVGSNFGGFTPGNTYYIQARQSNTAGSPVTTVFISPTATNSVCNGAIPLPARPAGSGCAFPNTNGGFFTWTATERGLTIFNEKTTVGNPAFIVLSVSVLNACNGTTIQSETIASRQAELLTGWQVGDDLIVRLFQVGGSTSIQFCAEETFVPLPPPNDACTAAQNLSVGAPAITGELGGATPSPSSLVATCNQDWADVYYTLTVPPTGNFNIIRAPSTGTSLSIVSACTGGTITSCTNAAVNTNFSPGSQVLVRVASLTTPSLPFTIRVEEVPDPPSNTSCAQALFAPVLPEGGCSQAASNQVFDLTAVPTSLGCSRTQRVLYYTYTATSDNLYFDGTAEMRLRVIQGLCSSGFPISGCLPPGNTVALNIGTTYTLEVSTSSTTADFCLEERQSTPRAIAASAGCAPVVTKQVSGSLGNPVHVEFTDATGAIFGALTSEADLGMTSGSLFDDNGGTSPRQVPKSSDIDLGRNLGFNPTTQPTGPVTVTFYVTDAELNQLLAADPNASTAGELRLAHVSGLTGCSSEYNNNGVPTPFTVTPYGSNWAFEFSVSSFSEFFILNALAPLPVELVDFSGTTEGTNNRLSWTVGEEINLSHYELHAASDPRFFNTTSPGETLVQVLPAAGQTTYSVEHYASQALTYYRLTAVDRDGSYEHAEVIALEQTSPDDSKTLALFPNPMSSAGGTLWLNGLPTTSARTYNVQVFSLTGQVMLSIPSHVPGSPIRLPELPAALYLLTVQSGAELAYRQLVVD